MANKQTDRGTPPKPAAGQSSERKTVPANSVGLSLTITKKALRDFDRIQQETIKAAEKDQKFSWR